MARLDPRFTPLPNSTVTEVADTLHGDGSALYDESLTYRYRLSRVWDRHGGRLLFVMLNPSTATAEVLDPTVARTVRWARSWGFGSLEVVNIFALRSTDPSALRGHSDPVGEHNDRCIEAAASAADLCVAAWGVHGSLSGRALEVVSLLQRRNIPLHVLGTTRDGHPRHPLYLPNSVTASPWSGYSRHQR